MSAPLATMEASARTRKSWTTRLASWVRTTHLYLSMGASLCIAFFAVSGLVANLRGDGSGEVPDSVPMATLASPDLVGRQLKTMLDLPAAPAVADAGEVFTANADLGDEQLELTVWKSTGNIEVKHWRALPPDLALDRATLAAWVAKRLGGEVPASDDADDPDAPRLELRSESVWRTHAVTIERKTRRWGDVSTTHSWASALADLHSGRHASAMQHVLMDVIAILLALSVISGTALGLVWIARSRRPYILIVTTGGAVCLLLLLVSR